LGAVAEQALSEAISRVLYPNDTTLAGQELRLKQEYFFTAASLQDLLRRHKTQYGDFHSLPDKVAIQLNDTHPALAVTELMRQLVDHERYPWNEAWAITQKTISYTNHTLLPEALESWPVPLIERLLPRHMQIIYRLNGDILEQLRAQPDTTDPYLSAVSLIDEQGGRRVRMGHLAFLGAHKVNGVSALHTELMKKTVFRDLHHYFPDRITNKTNGITPRRWLYQCNPPLSKLITAAIGDGWVDDLERLQDLTPLAEDASFRDRFAEAKRHNKTRLATIIAERLGIRTDPDALFDIQIKRIHEYKRQLLNILEAIALYDEIRAKPTADWRPRVKVFAGKAAASYHQAKTIIKLINDVAAVVNHDPAVRGKLKIVFLPNYNVSLAERIIPAADLSVQISTAGMEASGTGNMKFALNGALTIGTLDGANVEIKERVGDDNIFIFGMTADEVTARRDQGNDSQAVIEATPVLRDVLHAVETGVFSPDDPNRYRGLIQGLHDNDHFMVTADFAAYREAQTLAAREFVDQEQWFKKAVLNTANVGWFSSDRTIRDYAQEIWQALPPE
ncbi:MAG: glycogen/starch/alpha-glucan phosphorylase, partial [Pseudomonadota bacterium]